MIGRVLDASAVDAIMAGRAEAIVRLAAAREEPSPLLAPALALGEVRALRPHLLGELYELLEHPSIVRRYLDPATADQVVQLMARTGLFDICAGQVVVVAAARRWPILSTDPGRLQRLDPEIEVIAV